VGAVSDAGADGLTGWPVVRLTGRAGELHARPLVSRRLVEVLEVTAPALVLGSAQPATDTAADVAIEVARRRSGGGAVLLVPGDFTWVDVSIPRYDVLDDDDVARAFHWLGHAWASALRSLGFDANVHTGALIASPWSPRVCFAGVGAGEVLVDGRKVVGLSQRRTKHAVRYQSVVLHRWDPDALVRLLELDAEGARFLRTCAAAVDVDRGALVDALLAALP
jgi:lipoate-protein ligase A